MEIDELVLAREKLRETAELLHLAQEAASAGIWAWDVKRDVVWLSPECARLNCVSFHRALAPDGIQVPVEVWLANIHAEDKATVTAENQRAVRERQGFEVELRVLRSECANDSYRWLHSVGRVVLDAVTGEPLRVVGLDVDITRRKDDEARLAYMARHDELTGLANRRVFYERIEQAVDEARRERVRLSILAVDLDRFKWVNDTYGHPIGDALLRRVATALKDFVGGADHVARLGGDEFAVIRSTCSEGPSDGEYAARLIEAISTAGVIEGHAISVGASVGIAVFPDDGGDAEHIFNAADLALRTVKKNGTGSYAIYSKDMLLFERQRYELERDLRTGLANEDFELHYQPICEASCGKVVGFEALIRWRHPARGLVLPGDFISLAEETGLIVPIGHWALRTACAAAVSWPEEIGVAVNVSAVQLRRDGFPLTVAHILATSGLSPQRLEIEITETTLIQEQRAVGCIEDLRRLGVKIALDDFGTGYSSLGCLLQPNFDRIKLDRSFVTDIENRRAKTILRSVVKMAKALGMSVTAEGVETIEQFDAACSYGCTEMQGYLLGRPNTTALAPHGWGVLARQ